LWSICRSIFVLNDPLPFRGRGFSAYHPSWNPDRCGAVGDVFRDDRAGPGASSSPKFDGSHQHRVHPDEGAVADLGAVLVGAIEVGRDRTRADVGVLAEV